MLDIRAAELANSNRRLAKAIERLCDIVEGKHAIDPKGPIWININLGEPESDDYDRLEHIRDLVAVAKGCGVDKFSMIKDIERILE